MSTTLILARRRRAAGGGAFSPTDIAGLQLWFKADGIGGLSDGDPVSTWNDDSGNGRNATQAGAARPTYKTAILNSLPIVRFANASSQRMTFTGPTGFTALSIFAVVKRAATGGDHVVLSLGKTLIRIDATGNGNFEWHPDTDSTVIDGPDIQNTNWHIIGILQSSTNYEFRLDLASTTGTTVAIDAADRTDAIGSFEGGTTWPMNGDIAEIIVYDSDLSDADRDSVEGYLNTKWGLGL